MDIIKMVTEKAGISEDQAKKAVDTVVSFIKDKMPEGLGSQVESLLKGGESSVGDMASGLKDKIGGMFGN